MYPIIVFMAIFSIFVHNHARSTLFDEKFIMDQELLFVNINGCHIVSKSVYDESPCEIFRLIQNETVDGQCGSVLATPLFAAGNQPGISPRIFVVRHNTNKKFSSIEFAIVDIPYSRDKAISKQKIYALNSFPERIYVGSTMAGFLYDHTNHHVYLLTSNSKMLVCDVFLLSFNKKFFGSISISFLYKFDVDKTFSHAKWSTDPYRHQFYYGIAGNAINTTAVIGKQQTPVKLYSINFPLLVSSLKNGVSGHKFGEFLPSDASVQIAGDLIYVASSNKASFFTIDEPKSQRAHCRDVKGANFLLVLSGLEYCKLRNKDFSLCEGNAYGNQSLKVKWYHILIATMLIFLIALAVVLYVCRYRMSEKNNVKMNLSRPYSHYRSESFSSTF